MYRIFTIKDTVRVPPEFFSMELEGAITQLLREKYERKIDKDLGIILAIWNVANVSEGKIIPSDGAAFYDASFNVLSFVPEINEIFDAEVTEVVEFGVFLRLGPLEGLVHLSQITNDFLSFDKKMLSFVGKTSKKILRKGDLVRAKVSTISLKGTIPETKTGLTMRPEGLGKHEWFEEKPKEQKPKKEKEAKKEK